MRCLRVTACNADIAPHNILLVRIKSEHVVHLTYIRVHQLPIFFTAAIIGSFGGLKKVGILEALRGKIEQFHDQVGISTLNGEHGSE